MSEIKERYNINQLKAMTADELMALADRYKLTISEAKELMALVR